MNEKDWRLNGQEKYLYKEKLTHKAYKVKAGRDHDHCEFCWAKLPDIKNAGYCTFDETRWICEDCYNDFKEKFLWTLAEDK